VSWDPSESKTYSLTYMDDPFWKPLLTIGNSYDDENYNYKDDMIKRVLYNGDMNWNAAKKFEVTYQAQIMIYNVSKYPFDTHECCLMIVPFGYQESEIYVFRMDIKHTGRIRLSTKNMGCLFSFR
jgi:hypothetical protein